MGVSTKDKMLSAAIRLFQTQGFDRTSVRDIATEADVNVALISYHFGGKQGLYEKLVTQFLEGYLQVMKNELIKEQPSAKAQLIAVIRALLRFQAVNHHVARMVHREMTIDSTVVRELMATYFRKEKHDFEGIIRKGMKNDEFQKQPIDYVIIHLRMLITMPYLSPHYLRELYQINPSEPYFIDRYMEHLERWVTASLCNHEEVNAVSYYIPRSIS